MHILITSIIDLERTTHSRLHHFIEHLVSKGHKITIISIRDTWKKTAKRQNQDLIAKIDVHYITDRQIGPMMQKAASFLSIRKILKNIDLKDVDVHLAYNSLFLSYFVSRRLSKHEIMTIYDLADDLPDMIRTSPHLPFFIKPSAGWIGRIMLEKNMKMADMMTVTAHEFERSLGISRFKHELLPNGVDITRFRPKKKKSKGITVGYLGALREWVDLRPMLMAVKNLGLNDMKVLVVGGEEDLEQYKAFVKEQEMEKKVEFTGNVAYEKVPAYIAMMDIATIPFRKNRVTDGTCPVKLVEYMAMERPVICSRLNEIEHMVENKVLYASDAEEWEKQLSLLYHDGILRENLGKNGRKFVTDKYNWRGICQKMEDILKEHSKRKKKLT